MRIIVIGAEGAVGRAAISDLKLRHEIIVAGRSSGNLHVDVLDEDSIARMFEAAGAIDAIITTTGKTHFGPLVEMTPAQFKGGLDDKLMGQINIALAALSKLRDGGSITVTTGVTNRDPIRQGANTAAVNGALEAFVRSASIEMPRNIRINCVSPGLLDVSAKKYEGYFPGHIPVSSERVGFAYTKAVEGAHNGTVFAVDG
jgi:NAD(P)-dependent dehydrogenase (short-subunit alcohol dehydrogenase family)